MAGADSSPPGDAIPVLDTAARALYARRMHHRQIIRRGVITTLVMAVVGLLTAVAVPVVNQLKWSWLMQSAGFSVDWEINEDNWMFGGVTNVYFRHLQSWPPSSPHPDLRLLPRLLNVESVDLAECAVTEQELDSLRGLIHLRSLNLARLNHLSYATSDTGLSDACLIPIQGLRQLQELDLAGNRITDAGTALIAGMPELESLDLTATEVGDAGLVHLQTLKKLKRLSLGGTRVTPQGARALQSALPALEVIFEIDPDLERILKVSRRVHP